jgi:hypothetical protein
MKEKLRKKGYGLIARAFIRGLVNYSFLVAM